MFKLSNQIKNRNVFFSPAICLVLALMDSKKETKEFLFNLNFLGLVKKNLAKLLGVVIM